MLYLTETDADKGLEQEQADGLDNKTLNKIATETYKQENKYTAEEWQKWFGEINATTKGKGKKGKGGGPCWHADSGVAKAILARKKAVEHEC